jgi:hypothetical protein
MNTTTHEGRTYTLTDVTAQFPATSAEARKSGFDGRILHGISVPVGRQRKEKAAQFCVMPNGNLVCTAAF